MLPLSLFSFSSFLLFFLRVWPCEIGFPALRFALLCWRETWAFVCEEADEEAGEVAGEIVGETFDASEIVGAGESDDIDGDSETLLSAISS